MQRFSRHSLLIIFLFLFSFHSHADSEEFSAEFQDNFLHISIKIPKNHKIYSSKSDSLAIHLDESTNLQNFEIILPKPIASKFYEDNLDIKIALTPWDSDMPIHIRGNVEWEICDGQCSRIAEELNIKDCYIIESSIFNILLLAIIGGFILNFMPCVLPVLSLKIFSILKSGSNNRNELICSILGIFAVFWTLASSSVILKAFGLSFGLGLHFQEPIFIIFLTCLMTIFVSNIMNGMNFVLPTSLANLSYKNSYLNSFVTGAIAAIFSTPCTAPFLGTAIAFAATATTAQIYMIFSFIGLGFSLPYIALIIWPSLLRFFPKAGPWMDKLKLFLAVLMIATIFWLLTILYAQLGFRGTFGAALLLLLIKFVSEQKMQLFWKVILYLVVLIGLFNLPEMASKEDYQKAEVIKELWQEFDNDLLKKSMDEGKVIVIDITADWCGSCKYNKYMLWDKASTIELLSQPNIIAIRKDITSRSPETQRFMQSIGVYGIPFNVVFGPKAPKGIVLPTMLSYDDLRRALEEAGL